MTRDAKESLTAVGAVLTFLGVFSLALLMMPDDVEIARWLLWTGFAANAAILAVHILKRRRKSAEEPE